jgi:ferritin-like metal-binding protein YciE
MKVLLDLNELFIEQLREQYDGERRQLMVFPRLRSYSSSSALQQMIDHHIGTTKTQIRRLDRIFSKMKRNLHGEQNKAIEGLISEALELAGRCPEDSLRDLGISSSIRHFNHHDIATYSSLYVYASKLELPEIKLLLEESLKEEKKNDSDLYLLTHSLYKKELKLDH